MEFDKYDLGVSRNKLRAGRIKPPYYPAWIKRKKARKNSPLTVVACIDIYTEDFDFGFSEVNGE